MLKTRVGRTMVGKDARSSKFSSTKRKKSPQGENSPSPYLPIGKVSFQGKDSSELAKANIQVDNTLVEIAAMKIASEGCFYEDSCSSTKKEENVRDE